MRKFLSLATVVLLGAILAAGVYWWASKRAPLPDDDAPPAGDGSSKTAAPLFRDMTEKSGIRFTFRNGEEADHYVILESLGGGVALIDYDGDGLLDIFVTGGGHFSKTDAEYKKDPNTSPQILGYPCKLYKNLGNFRFKDVTREVGLDKIDFYTHGVAVADYNCDGWPDLLVTGYGRVALFKNVKDARHGRRFVEVTKEAGLLGPPIWATSAAWGDLDGDGYPDLYICQYVDWSWDNNPACEGYTSKIPRDVCPPRQFEARPHLLYRNNGNGTFSDIGMSAGLRMPRKPADYDRLAFLSQEAKESLQAGDRERNFGKGLGVIMADLNNDGRPEICVTNDTTDRFLYLNRSTPGKVQLEDVALEAGVAVDDTGVANGSMGLDVGDYDGSGRPSLLITNYENELHGLYRNVFFKGQLRFEYSTRRSGIDALGTHYVGFGTGFFDLDNDGWLDAVITNGHVIRHPTRSQVRQRPVLLRNQGAKAALGKKPPEVRLVNIAAHAGPYFETEHQGRGLAIGDLDNDGRPDLVISHVNAPVALLRNQAGAGNHWLGVELVGKGHSDVVGARITLEVGSRKLTRFAVGGGSYLSARDPRHIFGLGSVTQVGRLSVTWPSGAQQHWDGLAVDRYWQLVAGEKAAREWPAKK